MVPEMADAGVRPECLRANMVSGLTRLDALARLTRSISRSAWR
jgi:hypothetical protein